MCERGGGVWNRRWRFCRPLPCHLATAPGSEQTSLVVGYGPGKPSFSPRGLRTTGFERRFQALEVPSPLRLQPVDVEPETGPEGIHRSIRTIGAVGRGSPKEGEEGPKLRRTGLSEE